MKVTGTFVSIYIVSKYVLCIIIEYPQFSILGLQAKLRLSKYGDFVPVSLHRKYVENIVPLFINTITWSIFVNIHT